jgi:alpha-mannosidase
MRQDYPSLFQEIRGKVEEGQFQPIGGAWVECESPSTL